MSRGFHKKPLRSSVPRNKLLGPGNIKKEGKLAFLSKDEVLRPYTLFLFFYVFRLILYLCYKILKTAFACLLFFLFT